MRGKEDRLTGDDDNPAGGVSPSSANRERTGFVLYVAPPLLDCVVSLLETRLCCRPPPSPPGPGRPKRQAAAGAQRTERWRNLVTAEFMGISPVSIQHRQRTRAAREASTAEWRLASDATTAAMLRIRPVPCCSGGVCKSTSPSSCDDSHPPRRPLTPLRAAPWRRRAPP